MTYGGGGGPPSLEVRGRLLTNMLLTPPPPPGAEKGHILGILGQKTGKNAQKKVFVQKLFQIFPGRSRETSKNAINFFIKTIVPPERLDKFLEPPPLERPFANRRCYLCN